MHVTDNEQREMDAASGLELDRRMRPTTFALAAHVGNLCAALAWCVEHDGECLADHPSVLEHCRNILADARARANLDAIRALKEQR